jgi:nucleoside-diphosphate-sugar epimerase
MASPRFLVTGAAGFVGSAVTSAFLASGNGVVAAVRKHPVALTNHLEHFFTGDISAHTDWTSALKGITTVVHLAARVHIMSDTMSSPLAAFREVNSAATLNLAKQAAAMGARRFVFISSIGVNGPETFGAPYSELSEQTPHSDYAVSKLEAELALRSLCASCGMEFVIIRPPLVYHWNAPGNFHKLLSLVGRGMPLPFGSVKNLRSMINLPNLVDFIALCVTSPAAANEVFVIADGTDVSTPELIELLSVGMGKRARLIKFPPPLLKAAAFAAGKGKLYQQLCGSLQVDITKAKTLLGWVPPVTVFDGLQSAAKGYLREKTI